MSVAGEIDIRTRHLRESIKGIIHLFCRRHRNTIYYPGMGSVVDNGITIVGTI